MDKKTWELLRRSAKRLEEIDIKITEARRELLEGMEALIEHTTDK